MLRKTRYEPAPELSLLTLNQAVDTSASKRCSAYFSKTKKIIINYYSSSKAIMKHPSKHWNASLSFDSDLFQTNRNFFNSCGSSNGSSSNGSLSNGSLSSPEIFELAPGQAECCLSSGCQKGVFQETAMWVRMGCTNPSCTEVKQLHLECFSEWQTRFWNAINNSRSRHFSDFSIPPNITFMKVMYCFFIVVANIWGFKSFTIV